MTMEASSTESPHLRRGLHLWEAVGISLALMAHSMAANINPQFLALIVIGYTLLRNVYPYPTDATAWYPIIAALWVAGIFLTFVRNAATRRAGKRLMAEEGLAAGTGSRMRG